jgi:spore germination cell wall hydrolase CwlJ-like protein
MFSALCLAVVIYTEARGETLDGQTLVAEVVLNRVQSSRYPDDICSVAYQDHQFTGVKHGVDVYDPAFWLALELADRVMQGDTLGTDATHYHADHTTPYWASKLTLVGKYGAHIFYKE